MGSLSYLPSIDRVGAACFIELEAQVAARQDNLLTSFHLVYGKIFGKALEVVDAGDVTCYVGETSGRSVYQVQSKKSGDQYLVFPAHYCSCQAFQYDVVGRTEAACCKHQLAARLAVAMKRAIVVTVPDLAVAHMLLQHCA